MTDLELAVAQLEAELPGDAKLALQRVHAGQWRAAIYLWRMDGDDVHVPAVDTLAAAVAALRDRVTIALGSYPWASPDVRRTVELLDDADDRRAYIREVRASTVGRPRTRAPRPRDRPGC
jgi:hypothetical protein